MFPTSLQHPYAPRGRRRGRNDPNSRDYICPCGKSYLSYPALFTHIKIKHNGRAPGQIIKPKSQNPSKRGRPRQKQVYDSDSDTNDIAANCIDRLCDFVTEFQKPQEVLCSRLKDLYMKDAFYRVYVNYNPQEQEPRYNEREDLYEEYSDNVFCELIAEVNKRLNEPYHIDSVMVILMLLGHFVNENTVSRQNELEKRQDEQEDYDEDVYDGENDQEDENEQNEEIIEEQQYHSSSEQQQGLNINQKKLLNDQQEKPLKSQQKIPKSHEMIDDQNLIQNQNINGNNEMLNNGQAIQNSQEIQQEQQNFDQIEQNNQEALLKLKHEPIRNIVNYVNDFIINYQSKFYTPYNLQDYQFFQQNNIKIFLELFFNWLTMKKYVGFKVRVNQHYK